MGASSEYWFRKKEQGIIGLVWPITWQGWTVIISYVILMICPFCFKALLGKHFMWILVDSQLLWTILLVIAIRKKKEYLPKRDTLPEEDDEYWFPKKEMGIGWGFPSTWQGLLVLVVFIIGITLPSFLKDVLGKYAPIVMISSYIVWGIFLLGMVIKHGEK